MSWSEYRKDSAEKSRAMVLGLAEQIISIIRESGATEEETRAALKTVKALVPLSMLEGKNSFG